MTFGPGARLGPYKVTALIDEGGMGQVYRATDTNLGRQVAIKVLPDAFAADPERLARFEREARTLASLNHPNIAIIHGLEKAHGIRALVMELVEGPTLADRIAQGPILVDETLPIAKQIAEALEAAHEQGIIHRDLKPANIKLRPDGVVKVLDFGLAKALEPASDTHIDATASPTITSPAMMTGVGVLLGTAAYMSPEQARGKSADKRSDIWAFGCVLYEMLTGRRPFVGDDVSDTLAAVLRGEPDWSVLPPDTSASIRTLLRRCLAKDRRTRLDSAIAARLEIEDAVAAPQPPAPSGNGFGLRTIGVAVAAFFVAAAISAALVWMYLRPFPGPVVRLDITPPASMPFASSLTDVGRLALSNDGMKIVYASGGGTSNGLVLRQLNEAGSQLLPGTDGASSPAFSPDGSRLAFFQKNTLRVLTLGTLTSLIVCDVPRDASGISWDGNGALVFSMVGGTEGGLFRVSATGGPPARLTSPASGEDHVHPAVLPAGNAVLFTVRKAGEPSSIAVRPFDSSEHRILIQTGSSPRYARSGHLVFADGGALLAVSFDARRLETVGAVATIEPGIQVDGAGYANYALADNGWLTYLPAAGAVEQGKIIWKDRAGNRIGDAIAQALDAPRYLRLSPDGRRVALTTGPSLRGDVWVYSLTGEAQPLRLTSQAHNIFPIWTRDGASIVYVSRNGSRNTIVELPSDASSLEPRTIISRDSGLATGSWSGDGQWLMFTDNPGSSFTRGDLWILRGSEQEPRRWLETSFQEGESRFSPDGRWVAYVSDQTGSPEVWARPFPGPGSPVRVSAEGGHQPAWSSDGRELFFQDENRLMVVTVTLAPEPRFAPPRMLFEGGFVVWEPNTPRMYDVSPDGRFLMIERNVEVGASGIVLIQNWSEELKRLVPTH